MLNSLKLYFQKFIKPKYQFEPWKVWLYIDTLAKFGELSIEENQYLKNVAKDGLINPNITIKDSFNLKFNNSKDVNWLNYGALPGILRSWNLNYDSCFYDFLTNLKLSKYDSAKQAGILLQSIIINNEICILQNNTKSKKIFLSNFKRL